MKLKVIVAGLAIAILVYSVVLAVVERQSDAWLGPLLVLGAFAYIALVVQIVRHSEWGTLGKIIFGAILLLAWGLAVVIGVIWFMRWWLEWLLKERRPMPPSFAPTPPAGQEPPME